MVYSDIRARARAILAGSWASAVAVCLVAFVLGGSLIGLNFLPQITFKWHGEITSLEDAITALTTLSRSFGNTTLSIGGLSLLQLILGGIIGGIYRIVRFFETKNIVTLVVGLLCTFTGVGNFIAWIVDLVTELIHNRITVLAA